MAKPKAKKVVKKVEYKRVWVKCDLAYSNGGHALSEGPYADRGTEYRHYEMGDYFVTEQPSGYGFDNLPVPDWKDDADAIYAVVVHYSTGDTFGRSEGCIDIPIAFVNLDEANKVAKEIDSFDYRTEKNSKHQFQDEKYGFHKCWTGYFETLNGVEVKKLTSQGTPLFRSKR
jgi:hypothetical protein